MVAAAKASIGKTPLQRFTNALTTRTKQKQATKTHFPLPCIKSCDSHPHVVCASPITTVPSQGLVREIAIPAAYEPICNAIRVASLYQTRLNQPSSTCFFSSHRGGGGAQIIAHNRVAHKELETKKEKREREREGGGGQNHART